MVILAELEIFHSRTVAPTRRVAVGANTLPLDPPLRPGALLVAGVVGRYQAGLDDDCLTTWRCSSVRSTGASGSASRGCVTACRRTASA